MQEQDVDAEIEAGKRRGTVLSAIVEVLGLACLVAAGWMVAPALGMFVAGCGLLVIGQALDGAIVPAAAAVVARVPWSRLYGWVRRPPAARAVGEAT
jgi:hypothetical protein